MGNAGIATYSCCFIVHNIISLLHQQTLQNVWLSKYTYIVYFFDCDRCEIQLYSRYKIQHVAKTVIFAASILTASRIPLFIDVQAFFRFSCTQENQLNTSCGFREKSWGNRFTYEYLEEAGILNDSRLKVNSRLVLFVSTRHSSTSKKSLPSHYCNKNPL